MTLYLAPYSRGGALLLQTKSLCSARDVNFPTGYRPDYQCLVPHSPRGGFYSYAGFPSSFFLYVPPSTARPTRHFPYNAGGSLPPKLMHLPGHRAAAPRQHPITPLHHTHRTARQVQRLPDSLAAVRRCCNLILTGLPAVHSPPVGCRLNLHVL